MKTVKTEMLYDWVSGEETYVSIEDESRLLGEMLEPVKEMFGPHAAELLRALWRDVNYRLDWIDARFETLAKIARILCLQRPDLTPNEERELDFYLQAARAYGTEQHAVAVSRYEDRLARERLRKEWLQCFREKIADVARARGIDLPMKGSDLPADRRKTADELAAYVKSLAADLL